MKIILSMYFIKKFSSKFAETGKNRLLNLFKYEEMENDRVQKKAGVG